MDLSQEPLNNNCPPFKRPMMSPFGSVFFEWSQSDMSLSWDNAAKIELVFLNQLLTYGIQSCRQNYRNITAAMKQQEQNETATALAQHMDAAMNLGTASEFVGFREVDWKGKAKVSFPPADPNFQIWQPTYSEQGPSQNLGFGLSGPSNWGYQ